MTAPYTELDIETALDAGAITEDEARERLRYLDGIRTVPEAPRGPRGVFRAMPGVMRAGYRGVLRSAIGTVRGLGELGEAGAPFMPSPGLAGTARLAGLLRRPAERAGEIVGEQLGEAETTPQRLAEAAGQMVGTGAQYLAGGPALRAAGLVPRATGLGARLLQNAALAAPLDIAQGANPETSTAAALGQLGWRPAARVAETMPGRIGAELLLSNVVGGPLEAISHVRGLRRAKQAMAAENEALAAAQAGVTEGRRRAVAELTQTREELGQALERLRGGRQAADVAWGQVESPTRRALEPEMIRGPGRPEGTTPFAIEPSPRDLGPDFRPETAAESAGLGRPTTEVPRVQRLTRSPGPKFPPKPEGVTDRQWRLLRGANDEQLVDAFLQAQDAEERLVREIGGRRGQGALGRQRELQVGVQRQVEAIAQSRGITDLWERAAARRAQPATGPDEFLAQTHPENPAAVRPEDVPYEVVGGKARHDAMNGFRDAVMEVAASGESVDQAIRRFPAVQVFESERPGLFAEWVDLYRRKAAGGQPTGAINQALMRSLAGAGIGGAAGGALGAETAPEGQRGTGAIIGGLAGAALGAGLGLRGAKAVAREAGTLQRVALEPRGPLVSPQQAARTRPTGPLIPLPTEELDRFITHGNLDKFGLSNSAEGIERLRRSVQEAYTAAVERGQDWKRPMRWAEQDALAAALAGDSKATAAVLRRSGTRLNNVEGQALRTIYAENERFVPDAARQLEEVERGLRAMPPEERLRLAREYAERMEEQRVIIGQVSAGGSQWGRNLQSLRNIAKRTLDPLTWHGIARNSKGLDLTTGQRAELDALLTKGDGDGVLRYVASLRRSTRTEKFTSAVKAAWLFRLTTQARNILSTTANIGLHRLADGPAILADRATARLFGGSRTKMFVGGHGVLRRGTRLGWQEGKRIWRGGVASDYLDKMDIPRRTNYETPWLDTVVNKTFAVLGAEDAVMRGYPTQRAMAEIAAAEAHNAGFRGDALRQWVEAELAHPTPTLEAAAKVAGARETFQYSTRFSEMVNAFKAKARGQPLAEVPAELGLPFVRTPIAVAETAVRFSPVGYLSAGYNLGKAMSLYRKTLTPAEMGQLLKLRKVFAERFGQATVGTFLPLAAGWLLYVNGRMTGSRPGTSTEAGQWRTEGKEPFALRVGDRWWRMPLVAPIGSLMAFGAGLAETLRNRDLGETRRASRALSGAVTTLIEQPALTGPKQLLEAVTDVGGAGSRYLEGQISGVVPGAIAQAAQAADPYIRQPRGIVEAVATRLPGGAAALGVPKAITPLGDTARRDEGLPTRIARAMLDPFASTRSRAADDPLLAEMQRVGAAVGPLRRDPAESDEQYQARQVRVGHARRRAMDRARETNLYRRLPVELKDEFLEAAAEAATRGDRFNGLGTARRLILRAKRVARQQAGVGR